MSESRDNGRARLVDDRVKAVHMTLGNFPVDLADGSLEAVACRMLAYWLAGSPINGVKPSTIELGARFAVAPSAIRAALARMEEFPGPRTVATKALVLTYRRALEGVPVDPVSEKTIVDAYRRLRRLKSWGRPRKEAAR